MSIPPGPPAPEPGDGRFAATRWTLVRAARGDDARAREALAELCRDYYAPVVAFLRHDGRPEDDARELAHGFFARVLEGGSFDAADPSRGKFRSYLLGALKHHLQHQRRRDRAARRGGAVEHVVLDFPVADPSASDEAFARAFDRQWAMAVLDRALSTLAAEFEGLGKSASFEALKPWLGGDTSGVSQEATAAGLGMTVGALRVAIHRLRQRFARLVRAEIAQTVVGEAEVEEEIRHLLSAVAGR